MGVSTGSDNSPQRLNNCALSQDGERFCHGHGLTPSRRKPSPTYCGVIRFASSEAYHPEWQLSLQREPGSVQVQLSIHTRNQESLELQQSWIFRDRLAGDDAKK